MNANVTEGQCAYVSRVGVFPTRRRYYSRCSLCSATRCKLATATTTASRHTRADRPSGTRRTQTTRSTTRISARVNSETWKQRFVSIPLVAVSIRAQYPSGIISVVVMVAVEGASNILEDWLVKFYEENKDNSLDAVYCAFYPGRRTQVPLHVNLGAMLLCTRLWEHSLRIAGHQHLHLGTFAVVPAQYTETCTDFNPLVRPWYAYYSPTQVRFLMPLCVSLLFRYVIAGGGKFRHLRTWLGHCTDVWPRGFWI